MFRFWKRRVACQKRKKYLLVVSAADSNHSTTTRGRAVAARQAHNLEVAGSNPAPATKIKAQLRLCFYLA